MDEQQAEAYFQRLLDAVSEPDARTVFVKHQEAVLEVLRAAFAEGHALGGMTGPQMPIV